MSESSDIPVDASQIDRAFFARALKEFAPHDEIVSVATEIVGEGAGFLGDVMRVRLDLVEGATTPRSMILKIPAASENRRIGQTLGAYEREIRFYSELQPSLNIRTPEHYFSDMGRTPGPEQSLKVIRFLNGLPYWLLRLVFPPMVWLIGLQKIPYVLLIEDLASYRIGDQVGGCTRDEARRALDTMARMHSRFWGSNELDAYPWLMSLDMGEHITQMLYLKSVEEFKVAHPEWLSSKHRAQLNWLKENYVEMTRQMSEQPDTLVHGDFRLDNLCFDDTVDEVVVFDWQTPTRGTYGIDLAYFVSGTQVNDADDTIVDELLDYYRQQLGTQGIDVSGEQVRWQYECGVMFILHRMVFAETQQVLEMGKGRGEELLDGWIRRVLGHAEDIDAGKLLTEQHLNDSRAT